VKCQKNGTVVGKFYLGQAEEDSSDRLLPVHDDNDRSVGMRIRSRDVMHTLVLDSDVSVVTRSELRH
jgi:hypothetical protein